jgi:hypothetical protein
MVTSQYEGEEKMSKQDAASLETGVSSKTATQDGPFVELFGHVTLVEGYALPGFIGCHALVSLRDAPKNTVAVMTTNLGLQTLLETALSTGNLIAFLGNKLTTPPTPRGGKWIVDVYRIDGVILYGMK